MPAYACTAAEARTGGAGGCQRAPAELSQCTGPTSPHGWPHTGAPLSPHSSKSHAAYHSCYCCCVEDGQRSRADTAAASAQCRAALVVVPSTVACLLIQAIAKPRAAVPLRHRTAPLSSVLMMALPYPTALSIPKKAAINARRQQALSPHWSAMLWPGQAREPAAHFHVSVLLTAKCNHYTRTQLVCTHQSADQISAGGTVIRERAACSAVKAHTAQQSW
jgi:hypothetical protein